MADKRKKRVILEGPEPFDRGGRDMDMPSYDAMKQMLMTAMAEIGVTPDEYSEFLKSGVDRNAVIDQMKSMYGEPDMFRRSIYEPEEVHAMAGAGDKSLRLKVQMKDVTKPPMWREIVIPADFNFSQLHYAIQAVTGLENCHLWQFQHKAYNPDLQIGIPSDGTGFGLDDYTHDADETPVSGFLAKKGDKLEYVYDFGDDWIFTVSVLEVLDGRVANARCDKWKCDMQPIEDSGGVWAYLQFRDIEASAGSLSKKEKDEIIDRFYFDSFEQFMGWLDDARFDLDFVNENLADIPDKWEDVDG